MLPPHHRAQFFSARMTKAEISSFALLQAFAFLLFSSTSAQLHFNFNSTTLQPISIPHFTVGPGVIIPPIEVPYPANPFISLPDTSLPSFTTGPATIIPPMKLPSFSKPSLSFSFPPQSRAWRRRWEAAT